MNKLKSRMCSKLPLIIILGATGSGKTKLSLELAKKFGGEIIGADSMQIYKGLDIITAKVTKTEQLVAPHHLIDILEPNESYSVLEYRNEAVSIINKLISQNKLPIIVGGTNYYIESILWNILIDDVGQSMKVKPWLSSNKDHECTSQELYEKLKLFDPQMAKRLHPNNKRKILRSLEVLYQKGKKHSEILDEQHKSKGGSKTSGALRYPNSLILWLRCDKAILDSRLDQRVDEMLNNGLVKELTDFQKHFNSSDYTKGIFQSIGFKEFHSYFSMEEHERDSMKGLEKFRECTNLLKIATRQYARKQNRWITNRFLGRNDRDVPPVYGLDTSNLSNWHLDVLEPAGKIVESYISCSICPYEKLTRVVTESNPNADDETFTCEICDRIFIGKFQWKIHLKSNRHKRGIARKNKAEKNKGISNSDHG